MLIYVKINLVFILAKLHYKKAMSVFSVTDSKKLLILKKIKTNLKINELINENIFLVLSLALISDH